MQENVISTFSNGSRVKLGALLAPARTHVFNAKQSQEPDLLRGCLDSALDELTNLDFFGFG